MRRRREAAERTLCPSSRCKPGALLLGVVTAEGEIAFLPERTRITPRFAEIARQGRRPEARFRFAGACARNGCARWTGEGCGVAAAAAALADPAVDPAACAITESCQWRAEHGEEICRACRFVVTERDLSAFAPS